jgi:hypothetical protein
MGLLMKIWVYIVGFVVIMAIIPFTFDKIKESKIRVGVTYKYTVTTSNPFDKPLIRYFRVIDIKDGFVQYIDSTHRDTSSESLGMFIVGTEELK